MTQVSIAPAARLSFHSLLGVALLAGCGMFVDADQARVCRMALPALNPGARITITRAEPGPAPASLRLAYSVEVPDRRPLDRVVICQFAAEGLSPNKAELTGIIADQVPLTGASIYLLKRYYIDTPEGVAGDPGSGPGVSALSIPALARLPAPAGSGGPAAGGDLRPARRGLRTGLRPDGADQPGFRRTRRYRRRRDDLGRVHRPDRPRHRLTPRRPRPRAGLRPVLGGLVRGGRRPSDHRAHQDEEQPAEPDRHRRPLAGPDGIPAPRPESGHGVAAAPLVPDPGRRPCRQLPGQPHPGLPAHGGDRSHRRRLPALGAGSDRLRTVLAGFRRRRPHDGPPRHRRRAARGRRRSAWREPWRAFPASSSSPSMAASASRADSSSGSRP